MTRHPHAPAAELGDVESLGDGGRAVADDALAPLPTDAWITGTPEVLPGSPTTVGAGRVRLSDGWREYRRKAVRDHARHPGGELAERAQRGLAARLYTPGCAGR